MTCHSGVASARSRTALKAPGRTVQHGIHWFASSAGRRSVIVVSHGTAMTGAPTDALVNVADQRPQFPEGGYVGCLISFHQFAQSAERVGSTPIERLITPSPSVARHDPPTYGPSVCVRPQDPSPDRNPAGRGRLGGVGRLPGCMGPILAGALVPPLASFRRAQNLNSAGHSGQSVIGRLDGLGDAIVAGGLLPSLAGLRPAHPPTSSELRGGVRN